MTSFAATTSPIPAAAAVAPKTATPSAPVDQNTAAAVPTTDQTVVGGHGGLILPGPGAPVPAAPVAPYYRPPSIARAAADLVSRYDRNGDGRIDVDSESSRTEFHGFGKWGESTTYSIESLVSIADRFGNNDGKVGAGELQRIMRMYDTGDRYMPTNATYRASIGDRSLTGTENSAFQRAFGERSTYNPGYYPKPQLPPVAKPVPKPMPMPLPTPLPTPPIGLPPVGLPPIAYPPIAPRLIGFAEGLESLTRRPGHARPM